MSAIVVKVIDLTSSSAKHSAMDLMLRNEASLAPVHKSQIALKIFSMSQWEK